MLPQKILHTTALLGPGVRCSSVAKALLGNKCEGMKNIRIAQSALITTCILIGMLLVFDRYDASMRREIIQSNCIAREVLLSDILRKWGDAGTPNGHIHKASIEWYDSFVRDCSTDKSTDGFRSLKKAFFALVGTRGISDDAELVCEIVPALTRAMVSHPACIEDKLADHSLDDYEAHCVTISYKSAFAKLRQAAANKQYLEMVDSMGALWKNLRVSGSIGLDSCIDKFASLFQESLENGRQVPWSKPYRIPQVMVGPVENNFAESSVVLRSAKRQSSDSTEFLRSIPIWSNEDLRKSFKEPQTNRLSSPRYIATFLEKHWKVFLSEIDGIPEHLWHDPYPFLNPMKNGWGVFVLYHNRTFDEKRCRCVPRTCELVKSVLPATDLPFFHIYNEEAGFFRMKPGALIAPHSGPTNTILNTHVGLRGVQGAKFYVNGTEVRWREGETFTFEDSFEHWGSHSTNASETRVIFMMRHMHPDVSRGHYRGHSRTQAVELQR